MNFTRLWWGDVTERDNLEELGVDGRTILKLILRKLDGGMDWIYLPQDRER